MANLYIPGQVSQREQIHRQIEVLNTLSAQYGFQVTRDILDRAINLYRVDKERSRVMVAIPLYKMVFPEWFQTFRTLQLDFKHVNPAINLFITHARKKLAEDAIKAGYEYIFFWDDDLEIPPNTIPKLMSHNLDIVTGFYTQKGGEYLPNIYNYKGYNRQTGWYDYNNIILWEADSLVEIDGCGFGCMLVKTEVFKKIPQPWFRTVGGGEDFFWCRKAKKAGYKIYCDTSIDCEHFTVGKVGKRHYYANKLAVKFHDEVKGEVADVERLISEKAIELKVKSNVV